MRERYEPFLETKDVSIYQKGDKTLIVGEKEITFQTDSKILKRSEEPKTQIETEYGKGFKDGFRQGEKEAYFKMEEFLRSKADEK